MSNRTPKIAALFLMTLTAFALAEVSVDNVVAKQRYPWNGKVDITYTVTGDMAAELPDGTVPILSVTAEDRGNATNYVAAASALSGDTGAAAGAHHIVWDLEAQGLEIVSTNVVFTVAYAPPPYCVIDLSAGSNTASYPVSYLAEPPSGGFNTDEYKTTKLVLRRIEPGSFIMGGGSDESHRVTLTKPFYCGVFEVTQRQYELVTGSNPSNYKGDKRPVERVSWNTIRGDSVTYNWPGSANVNPNSFMGRLRARTGLDFDLPTEAQWEYACRAGTTTDYNNGTNYGGNDDGNDSNLDQLGRYWYNRSDGMGGNTDAHTVVGSYQPNSLGLYDMHGNVWEWCLDWYGTLAYGTDPNGASSGSYRVIRGGSWHYSAGGCTSSFRSICSPSYEDGDYSYCYGFRLVRTLSE